MMGPDKARGPFGTRTFGWLAYLLIGLAVLVALFVAVALTGD